MSGTGLEGAPPELTFLALSADTAPQSRRQARTPPGENASEKAKAQKSSLGQDTHTHGLGGSQKKLEGILARFLVDGFAIIRPVRHRQLVW